MDLNNPYESSKPFGKTTRYRTNEDSSPAAQSSEVIPSGEVSLRGQRQIISRHLPKLRVTLPRLKVQQIIDTLRNQRGESSMDSTTRRDFPEIGIDSSNLCLPIETDDDEDRQDNEVLSSPPDVSINTTHSISFRFNKSHLGRSPGNKRNGTNETMSSDAVVDQTMIHTSTSTAAAITTTDEQESSNRNILHVPGEQEQEVRRTTRKRSVPLRLYNTDYDYKPNRSSSTTFDASTVRSYDLRQKRKQTYDREYTKKRRPSKLSNTRRRIDSQEGNDQSSEDEDELISETEDDEEENEANTATSDGNSTLPTPQSSSTSRPSSPIGVNISDVPEMKKQSQCLLRRYKFLINTELFFDFWILSACLTCERLYTCPRDATRCLKSHGLNRCWKCNQTFKLGPTAFTEHNRKVHSLRKRPASTKCPYCSKSCPMDVKFRRHIEEVHFSLPEHMRSTSLDELEVSDPLIKNSPSLTRPLGLTIDYKRICLLPLPIPSPHGENSDFNVFLGSKRFLLNLGRHRIFFTNADKALIRNLVDRYTDIMQVGRLNFKPIAQSKDTGVFFNDEPEENSSPFSCKNRGATFTDSWTMTTTDSSTLDTTYSANVTPVNSLATMDASPVSSSVTASAENPSRSSDVIIPSEFQKEQSIESHALSANNNDDGNNDKVSSGGSSSSAINEADAAITAKAQEIIFSNNHQMDHLNQPTSLFDGLNQTHSCNNWIPIITSIFTVCTPSAEDHSISEEIHSREISALSVPIMVENLNFTNHNQEDDQVQTSSSDCMNQAISNHELPQNHGAPSEINACDAAEVDKSSQVQLLLSSSQSPVRIILEDIMTSEQDKLNQSEIGKEPLEINDVFVSSSANEVIVGSKLLDENNTGINIPELEQCIPTVELYTIINNEETSSTSNRLTDKLAALETAQTFSSVLTQHEANNDSKIASETETISRQVIEGLTGSDNQSQSISDTDLVKGLDENVTIRDQVQTVSQTNGNEEQDCSSIDDSDATLDDNSVTIVYEKLVNSTSNNEPDEDDADNEDIEIVFERISAVPVICFQNSTQPLLCKIKSEPLDSKTTCHREIQEVKNDSTVSTPEKLSPTHEKVDIPPFSTQEIIQIFQSLSHISKKDILTNLLRSQLVAVEKIQTINLEPSELFNQRRLSFDIDCAADGDTNAKNLIVEISLRLFVSGMTMLINEHPFLWKYSFDSTHWGWETLECNKDNVIPPQVPTHESSFQYRLSSSVLVVGLDKVKNTIREFNSNLINLKEQKSVNSFARQFLNLCVRRVVNEAFDLE